MERTTAGLAVVQLAHTVTTNESGTSTQVKEVPLNLLVSRCSGIVKALRHAVGAICRCEPNARRRRGLAGCKGQGWHRVKVLLYCKRETCVTPCGGSVHVPVPAKYTKTVSSASVSSCDSVGFTRAQANQANQAKHG